MLRDPKEFNDDEKVVMILHSLDGAISEAYDDQQDYFAYKNGTLGDLSEDKELDMQVIDLLVALGYSVDEMGTFLYKDVVSRVANYISRVSNRADVMACKGLISELKDPYSQFYFQIARNEKWMGCNTFHAHILKAHASVDVSKADPVVMFKVYSAYKNEMDTGEHAFLLGSYVAGHLMPKAPEKPVIKKLENLPDMRLKSNVV